MVSILKVAKKVVILRVVRQLVREFAEPLGWCFAVLAWAHVFFTLWVAAAIHNEWGPPLELFKDETKRERIDIAFSAAFGAVVFFVFMRLCFFLRDIVRRRDKIGDEALPRQERPWCRPCAKSAPESALEQGGGSASAPLLGDDANNWEDVAADFFFTQEHPKKFQMLIGKLFRDFLGRRTLLVLALLSFSAGLPAAVFAVWITSDAEISNFATLQEGGRWVYLVDAIMVLTGAQLLAVLFLCCFTGDDDERQGIRPMLGSIRSRLRTMPQLLRKERVMSNDRLGASQAMLGEQNADPGRPDCSVCSTPMENKSAPDLHCSLRDQPVSEACSPGTVRGDCWRRPHWVCTRCFTDPANALLRQAFSAL